MNEPINYVVTKRPKTALQPKNLEFSPKMRGKKKRKKRRKSMMSESVPSEQLYHHTKVVKKKRVQKRKKISNSFDGLNKRPRTLFCHLCCREFGFSSIEIHRKTCIQKYRNMLALFPKTSKIRREKVPKFPSNLQIPKKNDTEAIINYNNIANEIFFNKSRKRCPGCSIKLEIGILLDHIQRCKKFEEKIATKKRVTTRPRFLVCYICGKEYGSASLKIHQKTCKEKFLREQSQLPKNQRKTLPSEDFLNRDLAIKNRGTLSRRRIDKFNQEAFSHYNHQMLIQCEHCGRTFSQNALTIHQRSCTRENPAKRVVSSTNLSEKPKKRMPKKRKKRSLSKRLFDPSKTF